MGWPILKLSEVSEIGSGNSAPQKKEFFLKGVHPFIRTSDVGQIKFGSISDARDKLNDKGVEKLRLIPKGAILFPKSGASTFLNHRVILASDSYVSSHLATIKAHSTALEDRFLLYYLSLIKAQDLVQDHDYPSLRLSDLSELEVPVPSLSEQKHIVAILDQAFADIDKARALTEQNLKNARELFESYLQQVFSQRGDGWATKKIGELVELSRGYNPPKSDFIFEPKPGYIRFYQIRDGKSDKHATYVPDNDKLRRVSSEDILMVAYRHIGGVFRGAEGAFNVALCKLSNWDEDLILGDYLYAIIPTDWVKGELLRVSERSLIPSMSVKHLAGLEIPVPPIGEQRQLVSMLSGFKARINEVESIYNKKLSALEELKKSLLQKAFSGELTKDNQEAA